MVMVIEHVPDRPRWDCLVCEKPWPCDPAREALAAEYKGSSVALSMYLWAQLELYALESGPGPMQEAYDRFIRWSRR